jgi:hypothetical protein
MPAAAAVSCTSTAAAASRPNSVERIEQRPCVVDKIVDCPGINVHEEGAGRIELNLALVIEQ